MSQDNISRFELKFKFPVSDYYSLLAIINESNLKFRKSFPNRSVNSIYFDNTSLRNLSDNISGADQRVKVRIRWYNNELSKCKLEVKMRDSQLIRKRNFNFIKSPLDSQSISCTRLVSNLKSNCSPSGSAWFDHSSIPALFVTYDREYFQSFDNNIRVTIDTSLKFRELMSPSRVFGPLVQLEEQLVLEVKFSPDHETQAWHLLRLIPKRISTFSKYQTGWSLFDF